MTSRIASHSNGLAPVVDCQPRRWCDWVMPRTPASPASRPYETRFCSRLQQLRALRGLSQEKLSAKTGIAQSTISKMEKGQKIGVTLTHALAICEALRVDLFEMVSEGDLQVVTIK